MAFNPSSTIYLCNVPIDSTYKHQIYFGNRTAQFDYFFARADKIFTEYLTVRKTKPDGSLQSSVRVNANIDDLYGCNYMFYQNGHHGTKWFYAFITNLVYINEGTTEIVFETDVWQTWMFDANIENSYVIREHSTVDFPGSNTVPESFNMQNYVLQEIMIDDTLDDWGYLIGTSEHDFDSSMWEELFGKTTIRGQRMSGIYQGVYFYYFEDTSVINTFIETAINKGEDCILFITLIPKFCVSNNGIGLEDQNDEGWVYGSSRPAEKEIDLSFSPTSFTFDGYTPKNKKLYTAPFFKMVITNHNGQIAEYAIEDFEQDNHITFTMYGDISANPSVTLVPNDYKGVTENFDEGISISNFPQCSFTTDTFKMWLAKNQFSIAGNMLGNAGIIAGSVAATALTGGGYLAVAGATAMGANAILSTINEPYQASLQPNRAQTATAKSNLITAIKENKFRYYIQTIKPSFARTIDDYFTMYGYQTNKIKTPNLSARPYYNYVQTADINITGTIPCDDMRILKAMFNNGVTLWKPNATVGDYSVDNSI